MRLRAFKIFSRLAACTKRNNSQCCHLVQQNGSNSETSALHEVHSSQKYPAPYIASVERSEICERVDRVNDTGRMPPPFTRCGICEERENNRERKQTRDRKSGAVVFLPDAVTTWNLPDCLCILRNILRLSISVGYGSQYSHDYDRNASPTRIINKKRYH